MTKSIDMPKTPPTVHFSFQEKSQMPKGVDSLQLGKEVTLIVKGKVSSLHANKYGSGFSIENPTVKIDESGKLRRPMR